MTKRVITPSGPKIGTQDSKLSVNEVVVEHNDDGNIKNTFYIDGPAKDRKKDNVAGGEINKPNVSVLSDEFVTPIVKIAAKYLQKYNQPSDEYNTRRGYGTLTRNTNQLNDRNSSAAQQVIKNAEEQQRAFHDTLNLYKHEYADGKITPTDSTLGPSAAESKRGSHSINEFVMPIPLFSQPDPARMAYISSLTPYNGGPRLTRLVNVGSSPRLGLSVSPERLLYQYSLTPDNGGPKLTRSATTKSTDNTGSKYSTLDNVISSTAGMLTGLGLYLSASGQTLARPNIYAPNQYAQQALTTMARRRANVYPQLRAMQDAEARNRFAIRNSGGLTGAQKALMQVASGIGLQRNYADVLANTQQLNNQYASDWANLAYNAGSQDAQLRQNANQFLEQAYAQAHGAREQQKQTGIYNMLNYFLKYYANRFKYNQWQDVMGRYDDRYGS